MGRCANHLPDALASALVKISRIAEGLPNDTAEGHTTTAPLFIVNPLSGRGMDNLFYLSISSLPLGSSAALVSIKSANFPPAKPSAGAKCLRCAYLRACSSMKNFRITIDMIENPDQRIDARKQIAFLEIAAEALHDKFLGFSLAEDFDCKELGLLYYVMASSETLGGALERASRYSRITNEAIVLEYRAIPEPALRLSYSGIPRHADLQQIEFCILAMVRVSRLLSGRQFSPKRISCMHSRTEGISKFARFLGNNIEFGRDSDEIVYPAGSPDWALVNADPRLNKILLKVCDESLNARKSNIGSFRITVENVIAPLLPHGQAHARAVATKLGMSERTLARRLAEEDVTFIEVLQQLKASLAIRYLEDDRMPISRIAWLLGFEDASSFSHACRRWTGKSPREIRHFDTAAT